MGTIKTEVKVVSKKTREIRDRILTELDRGVTILYAESGYLRQKTELVRNIVSKRELPRLERMIREIDPERFVVISRVSEVRGRVFSMDEVYRWRLCHLCIGRNHRKEKSAMVSLLLFYQKRLSCGKPETPTKPWRHKTVLA